MFPKMMESITMDGYTFSYLFIQMTMKNETEQEVEADSLFMQVNYKQYANGVNSIIDEIGDEDVSLKPGEEKSLWMVFRMASSMVDDFQAEDARVIFSVYPVQIEMKIA